jgi:transposase InsO family protein
VATGRAVCGAFVAAMERHGVPGEVLTDNGKQLTGRFAAPWAAEVMFERICRENGITLRHTRPRSPTTTGKIEHWHQSLDMAVPATRFTAIALKESGLMPRQLRCGVLVKLT